MIVTGGGQREEHDGLTLKKGRTNIATKVNSASTLVRIEETGTEAPRARQVHADGAGGPQPRAHPARLRGRRRQARGHGRPRRRRRDHDGLRARPDGARANGDDTKLRDQQGKLIAHCEMAGDRMAILDAPADMIPQDIHEWRNNDRRLRLQVRDAVLAVARGHGPAHEPAADGAAVRPRRRRVGAHRQHARRAQGAGQRGRARRQRAGLPDHPRGAGRAQPVGHQLHPQLPRPRHPHLGRAHALERPRVALPERAPALQLPLGVDPRGHAVGRLRAQRRAPLDPPADRGRRASSRAPGARARCSARRRRRRSTSSATPRRTRPTSSTPARSSSRSASRRSSRPSS